MAEIPNVNPSVVVQRLGNQIGGLTAELAMRDTQLEAALERISELEAQAATEKPDEKPDEKPSEKPGAPKAPKA